MKATPFREGHVSLKCTRKVNLPARPPLSGRSHAFHSLPAGLRRYLFLKQLLESHNPPLAALDPEHVARGKLTGCRTRTRLFITFLSIVPSLNGARLTSQYNCDFQVRLVSVSPLGLKLGWARTSVLRVTSHSHWRNFSRAARISA